MGRRGQRKPKLSVGDVTDPRGMARLSSAHLEWMRVQNYSEQTVTGREKHLRRFTLWCEERSITRPTDVTKPILERYARWLYHHRKDDGRPLSFGSQYGQLMGVRMFFRWLARHNHILSNPASELELPRREKRLPKHVLTISEAEAVINQPNPNEALGLRDRAILETFYSTGMRRMELVNLKLFDVDFDRGTVLIHGKGKKDRMIPIGDRALAWVEKYLNQVRPSIVVEPDEGWLFLTKEGTQLIADHLSSLVKRYVEAANTTKTGACHLFRHTMATLMLEGGADVRYIQQMLGHSRLETTEVYTHVSIRTLKAVHSATHPAHLQRPSSEPKLLPQVAQTSVCDGDTSNVIAESIDNAAEDLLLSLAAEAAEEEHSLAASHFAN
ncbi:MAG: site-specific tyrosine recombinase XerC [Pyrinomonadaceae bacterium]